jgi:hypothetical protein
MRESYVRTMEAFIAITASYMSAVTMVQTTLYNKIITKITNSMIGPLIEPYYPYISISVVLVVLFASFTFWRKGDEIWFGRLFNLNLLMFFPSVLDFSTFNWVGLIFDLTPNPGVTHLWVFTVGLLLQISYLLLRYTVRFRYVRSELIGRGADQEDINTITRGQVGYLVLLTSLTAFFVAAIYILLPYIAQIAINPLGDLPAPHIFIGLFVVLFIAVSMVTYLRSRE